MVFYPDCSHRRKSSLAAVENPRVKLQADQHDDTTACFVHSLIAGEWGSPSRENLPQVEGMEPKVGGFEPAIDDAVLATGENETMPMVNLGDKHAMEKAPTIMQSRNLTKRQLSDMAWNVRKLSKKLGSIKLNLTVRSVFVVTKAQDEALVSLARKVTQWLLSKERDAQYTVYVEKRFETDADFAAWQLIEEEPSAKDRLRYWDMQLALNNPHLFDFVVTLGGDGTVLYTSWLFQRIVPPVLSFSLGSLGFLTKFDFNEYQHILNSAFRDGVIVSLRLRFECTIMRSNKHPTQALSGTNKRDLVEELLGEEVEGTLTHTPDKVVQILNDVVLDRGPNPSKSHLAQPRSLYLQEKGTNNIQPCPKSNCSATTNITRLFLQMESALLHLRAQRLITSRPEDLSHTPKTP